MLLIVLRAIRCLMRNSIVACQISARLMNLPVGYNAFASGAIADAPCATSGRRAAQSPQAAGDRQGSFRRARGRAARDAGRDARSRIARIWSSKEPETAFCVAYGFSWSSPAAAGSGGGDTRGITAMRLRTCGSTNARVPAGWRPATYPHNSTMTPSRCGQPSNSSNLCSEQSDVGC